MIGRAASIVRSLTPPATRAWLRRSRLVNAALRGTLGGTRSRPHAHAPFTIYFDGYRNLGWNFADPTAPEAQLFVFAKRLLEALRPACAWDVGANVGLWSLFLAGFEPRIAHVVSFEPDQTNLRLLHLNRERNGLAARLDVREIALSDRPGAATFNADPMTGSTGSLESGERFIEHHYGGRTHAVQMAVGTIDDEIASGRPVPQFMKIDVEGHELALLRGGLHTLGEHRPALLIEVTRHADEVAALLREREYLLFDPETARESSVPTYMTAAIPSERADLIRAADPTGGISP